MKLFIAFAISTAFLAAVDGKGYDYKCIKMDINGTVTITANNTKTKGLEKPVVIDLSTAVATTSGNCSGNTTVQLTVMIDNVTWVLTFNNSDNKVTLSQDVSFKPVDLFNGTAIHEPVTVASNKSLFLSSDKASYECDSELTIAFIPMEQGNYTFEVFQNITSLHVQAFGLPANRSYSPAEHCSGDSTTVSPMTVATTTTAPTPTMPPPAGVQTFVLKDSRGVVCFRLEAGLQFVVEYENKDKKMILSGAHIISGSANVTGTCSNGSVDVATMTITGDDYSLTIMETRSGKMALSAINLTVMLDPKNFPDALNASETVSFELTAFKQSSADTFYVCDSQQRLTFTNSTTTLFASNVHLQAFNLNNGSFSGEGDRCGLDPTPSPMPPAATPGDNMYTVSNGNVTCIVFKGEIMFSNVTYNTTDGIRTSRPIVIPSMNETTQNVKFNGSCSLEEGKAQDLTITFNSNWTLTLTFAKGSSSAMLGASADHYSVRDIKLVYYLIPEFFPNASDSYPNKSASKTNISSDFMKGSINGGSYKCYATETEVIGDGIEFKTAKLQFKAFNNDNSTTFNSNVSQCPADDESNSIVPIAVGAALAGLVAIVLVAYLIGRRRSRRQGYESV